MFSLSTDRSLVVLRLRHSNACKGCLMELIRKVLKLDVALLALALILAVVLNWSAFVVDYLAIDEHVSFWISDRSSPSNLLDRSINYSATPPLSFVLQRICLDVFGPHEWALRLPSAVAYLAAIVAIWWLGCNQHRPLTGGLAAVLLATQPVVQDYAVVGRPYSLGILFGVLAMVATLKRREQPDSRLRWLAWAVVNLALVQTHYLFAALWGAELVWLAWPSGGQPFSLRRLVGAALTLTAIAATVAPGLLRVWEHRLYLNWTTRTPSIGDLCPLVLPIQRDWFEHPIWWGLLATPFAWLLIAQRRGPKDWFEIIPWKPACSLFGRLLIWFVLPVGGLWFLGRFWFPSLAAGRYLVVYVPAAALLLAALLSSLRGIAAPILVCFALVLSWQVRPVRGQPIQDLRAQLHQSLTLSDRVDLAWKGTAGSVDAQENAGRAATLTRGATPVQVRLVLVSSGLAEMSLVPVYLHDPVFHDYVSCRLGRMYLMGSYQRLSVPLFWTDEARAFFREAIVRASEKRDDLTAVRTSRPVQIVFVFARDTDLLRASAEQAKVLLRAAGAKEFQQVDRSGLTWITYYFDDDDH